jgi:hypothetical protein
MNTGNNNGSNNKARSNEGFRPFTPPAKNNPGNGRSNENYNRNQGSTNDSRPPQHHHEAAPQRQAPHPAPQQHSSPPAQHHAPPPAPHHGKGF